MAEVPFKRRGAYSVSTIWGGEEPAPPPSEGTFLPFNAQTFEDIAAALVKDDPRLRGLDVKGYAEKSVPPLPSSMSDLDTLLGQLVAGGGGGSMLEQLRAASAQGAPKRILDFMHGAEGKKLFEKLRMLAKLNGEQRYFEPRFVVFCRPPLKAGKGGRAQALRDWQSMQPILASPGLVEHSIGRLRERMQAAVQRVQQALGTDEVLAIWMRSPGKRMIPAWTGYGVHADGSECAFMTLDKGQSWLPVWKVHSDDLAQSLLLTPDSADMKQWLVMAMRSFSELLAPLRTCLDRTYGPEGLAIRQPLSDEEWGKVASSVFPPSLLRSVMQAAYEEFTGVLAFEADAAADAVSIGLERLRKAAEAQQLGAEQAMEKLKSRHRREVDRLQEQVQQLHTRSREQQHEISQLRARRGPEVDRQGNAASVGAVLRDFF